MMLVFIFIVFIMCCRPVLASEAIYFDAQPQEKITVSPNGVLQGAVSASKELPDEFYGTWSVSSILVRTNNPYLFKPKSSDIWTLLKQNDVITLSNPVSGARASITVDEVMGSTARFTRKKITKHSREYETPSITIDGDSFSGTDTIVVEHYRGDKLIRVDVVEYEVNGTKISGPTLKEIFYDK